MEVSLLFTRTDRWISKFIRWFTKSEFSHVTVLLDTTVGDNMLLDVTFGGYRLVPLERFLKNGNEIVHKITIKHDVSNGIKKVGRWLDVPYDYKGLLSFINPLNRIFKKTLIDPTENPNSLICSEMVIVMLQTSDYPNAHMLIAHKTSPKQLYEFVLVNELL